MEESLKLLSSLGPWGVVAMVLLSILLAERKRSEDRRDRATERAENRADRAEQWRHVSALADAVDRMTRGELLRLISSTHLSDEEKRRATDIVQEIEKPRLE